MRFTRRARALMAATVATVGLGLVGPAQSASAAPLPINLEGETSSHLAGLINSDITFSSTFEGGVDVAAGTFEGTFATGPGVITFNALGIIPVETEVQLHFTEPVTGTVELPSLAVDVTATLRIELTAFSLFGVPMLDPAQTCESVSTTTANLQGTFNAQTGIVLTEDDYTIPAFQNCGFLNDWVTMFTSGSGHSIEATLAPVV